MRGRRALRRAPIGTGRPARARRHCRVPALRTSAPARTGGPARPIVHVFFEVRYTNLNARRDFETGVAELRRATCRRGALGPGSALAGGGVRPSAYRGARWAGTRERCREAKSVSRR